MSSRRKHRAREAKNRLARIGFDRVGGHLPDPEQVFAAHPDEVVVGSRLDVDGLREVMNATPDLQLVDVRGPGETDDGIIEGAILMPLPQLNDRLATLGPSWPTVVYCAGGYRSSIAASRLVAAGFADVADLLGGYGAWEATPTAR